MRAETAPHARRRRGRSVDATIKRFGVVWYLMPQVADSYGRYGVSVTNSQIGNESNRAGIESLERSSCRAVAARLRRDGHAASTPTIKRLRRRLEPDPAGRRFLLTVWGVGYKFTDGDESNRPD